MKNKTEQLTSQQLRALVKPTGRPPSEKKVTGGKAQMDLSRSDEERALMMVNVKVQGPVLEHKNYYQFWFEGQRYQLNIKKIDRFTNEPE